MPTQEQKALARYEALKSIIQERKQINGDMIFAEMFQKYGILERTTSRYLKYLKMLNFITTKGDMIFWNPKQKS